MRVWEFQDNKAIATDLVREQDFILRVRRLQRQAAPSFVLNIVLNAIDPLAHNLGLLEETQKKLEGCARATNGSYYEMSNGDVFLVWDSPGDVRTLITKAMEGALAPYQDQSASFLLNYRMPENYTVLRERTNYYVELARSASTVNGGFGRIDETQGKLTARNVDQIEQLLGEIDLRHYGRTQTLYRDAGGTWDAVGEEYFISFEDLRRERFPKLDIAASDHFFFSLCGVLDQKLLAMLTNAYDTIAGRRISLNLSIGSIVGSVFTQFVRRVPQAQRNLIEFELHRGDLLQDFSLTLSVIELLKREGFRVALDSVTPDMVNYLNLDAFEVDRFKINVSKDRVLQLADPAIRSGLARLQPEKLIFFRCDNERALTIGRELGVTLFQGWLIDDLATKQAGS